MPWLQLKVNSSNQMAEQVEDTLIQLGAVAVTFEDNADEPIFEPPLGETPLWHQTRITGIFDTSSDTESISAVLLAMSDLANPLQYSWELLEDKDWEREWIKHYHPIQCGKRLWICPSWIDPPHPEQVNLMLDPGLAFGTGTHPTTFLCLQWLDQLQLQGKTITDYGCGSGILAIAALLLGATSAICIDIDHQALTATTSNALHNKLAPSRARVYLPEHAPAITSDIVLANILAGPLIAMAPKLAKLTKPSGLLCLSGILEDQTQDVMTSYQPWFDFDPPVYHADGWARLTATKQSV